MGVSTLFSHKPHVVVHDFTEFSINAKHFQLFEGKSKKPRLFCGPAKNLRGPAVENHWFKASLLFQRRDTVTVCCAQKTPGMTSEAESRSPIWRKRNTQTTSHSSSTTWIYPCKSISSLIVHGVSIFLKQSGSIRSHIDILFVFAFTTLTQYIGATIC